MGTISLESLGKKNNAYKNISSYHILHKIIHADKAPLFQRGRRYDQLYCLKELNLKVGENKTHDYDMHTFMIENEHSKVTLAKKEKNNILFREEKKNFAWIFNTLI